MRTRRRSYAIWQRWLMLIVAGVCVALLPGGCDEDGGGNEGNDPNRTFKLISSSPSDGQRGADVFNSPFLFLKFNNDLDPDWVEIINDSELYEQWLLSPDDHLRIESVFLLSDFFEAGGLPAGQRGGIAGALIDLQRRRGFQAGLSSMGQSIKELKKGSETGAAAQTDNSILVIELNRRDDFRPLLFNVGQEYTLTIPGNDLRDVFGHELDGSVELTFTPEPRFRVGEIYPEDGSIVSPQSNIIYVWLNDEVDPASVAGMVTTNPSLTFVADIYESNTLVYYYATTIFGQNGTYRYTVDRSLRSAAGQTLAADVSGTFKTEAVRIVATEPDPGAADVSPSTDVMVEYNVDVTSGDIELQPAAPGLEFTFDRTVAFFPSSNLMLDTVYTVTVSNVRDLYNNVLPETTFTFRTEPFRVTSTTPSNGAIQVPRNSTGVVYYNALIDTGSVANAVITVTPSIAFTIQKFAGANFLYIDPAQNLQPATTYTVSLKGVKSTQNKVQRDYSLVFTTEPRIAWSVTSTSPADGDTGVPINAAITIYTDQVLDTSTIRNSFSMAPTVAGTFVFSQGSTNFSFIPTSNMATQTQYTVTIGATLTNQLGDPITPYSFTFRTSSTTASAGLSDDFDPGIDFSQWTSISGGSASANCGSVLGLALWFDGSGTRSAVTKSLNVSAGGTVSFAFKFGTSSAPCETADPGEDVWLLYSTNGIDWFTMGTYSVGGYATFTSIQATIPPAAYSASTQFQWLQITHSGSSFDNWAMDNVVITLN